jgi:hypothetical protein
MVWRGTTFEGYIMSGTPPDAIDDAVRAKIVAAAYGNSGYDTAKGPAAWMVLGSRPFQCCSTTWALHSGSVA